MPASLFPWWVVRKIGEPILLETDWATAMPNCKFGMFATSTGTLTQDTANLRVGGAGSCKMLTAALSNDSTELKYSHHYINPKNAYLALEMKWAMAPVSAGTNFQLGIENRDNANIKHVRFRYTSATSKWMYEDNALAYQDFPNSIGGPLLIEKPNTISATSGTKWGWVRCVIDPTNGLYVGLEAAGQKGIETRDMRPMQLPVTTEGAATAFELLFFSMVVAGSASAETAYCTDWCASIIPPGEDPFAGAGGAG